MHVVFYVLYEIVFLKPFLFHFFKNKSKWVSLDVSIFLTFTCCIIVLYKCVLCVLYFSKEKNNLINGERKLEEQWLGLGLGLGLGLLFCIVFFCVVFFMLYFSVLYI